MFFSSIILGNSKDGVSGAITKLYCLLTVFNPFSSLIVALAGEL